MTFTLNLMCCRSWTKLYFSPHDSLFLRSSISVKVTDDTPAPEVDDGVGDYQYDNPTDQASFCPNLVCSISAMVPLPYFEVTLLDNFCPIITFFQFSLQMMMMMMIMIMELMLETLERCMMMKTYSRLKMFTQK